MVVRDWDMPALSFQRRICLPERRHQLTRHRHAHVQVPLEARHEPPWRQSDRKHSAAVRIYSSFLGKHGYYYWLLLPAGKRGAYPAASAARARYSCCPQGQWQRRHVLLGSVPLDLDGDQEHLVSWSTLQHPGIHVDGVLLLSGIMLVAVRVVFVLVAASSA